MVALKEPDLVLRRIERQTGTSFRKEAVAVPLRHLAIPLASAAALAGRRKAEEVLQYILRTKSLPPGQKALLSALAVGAPAALLALVGPEGDLVEPGLDEDKSASLQDELRGATKEAISRAFIARQVVRQTTRDVAEGTKRLVSRIIPTGNAAVRKAQEQRVLEEALSQRDVAAAVRRTLPEAVEERIRSGTFGAGAPSSRGLRNLLVGLGASVPVAGALYLTKKTTPNIVVEKRSEMAKAADHLAELLRKEASYSEVRDGVKEAALAFRDVWQDTATTLKREKRSHLTEPEVQKVAETFTKVANLLGHKFTVNEFILHVDEPTLDKVALVGTLLGAAGAGAALYGGYKGLQVLRHGIPAGLKAVRGQSARAMAGKAGLEITEEAAKKTTEEAAKKGLEAWQAAALAGGGGLGAGILTSNRNREPSIRVTKL